MTDTRKPKSSRFIAGAVCPKCNEVDRIVVKEKKAAPTDCALAADLLTTSQRHHHALCCSKGALRKAPIE